MQSYEFGSHLKEIRTARRLTQAEMSDLLHISRQAYSNYEQGRCVPPVTTLLEMSIILQSNLLIYFIQGISNFDSYSDCLQKQFHTKETVSYDFIEFTNINQDNSSDYVFNTNTIPEYEIISLLTLYNMMDMSDRISIIENMIIRSNRK